MRTGCKNTYCNKHVSEIIVPKMYSELLKAVLTGDLRTCCAGRVLNWCRSTWVCVCMSLFMHVLLCVAHIGWEPVGRCGLVDVVLVVVCVGAALCGLPLPPADRATLHHTAAHLGWCLLRGSVWITVFCHHSVGEGRRWKYVSDP